MRGEAAPTAVELVARAAWIAAVLAAAAARLAARLAVHRLRRPGAGRMGAGAGRMGAGGAGAAGVAGAVAADTLQRLGPAFVKAGQLLSTRVDVLPAAACAALARLYDGLPVLPPPAAGSLVPAGLLAELDGLTPVAAGSIACVYRARLPDGRTVAVKVRRPGIGRTMHRDLRLLGAVVAAVQRLPWLRGVPMADMVEQVGECIRRQLDFDREAAALRALRENLAELDGVRVPAVLDAHCGPGVLVMEYVDGLRRGAAPAAQARTATIRALRAVYHMLFLDGFVHCDLHPGNLYPMPDGTVVIVDAGFSRRLTETARRGFASFFYQMSRGNGAACADIVLSTAQAGSNGRRADPERFRASMAELVERNHGLPVAEFDLVVFAVRLFAIQREHGYYADPQFVFPILSLIVLEGTLRGMCPDVDFQTEAIPFVLRGLMR